METPDPETIYLELFIVSGAPNSEQAIASLHRLCSGLQAAGVKVVTELVDISEYPARLLESRVVVTPTLIRRAPAPEVRVLGNLNNLSRVSELLGLQEWPHA